MDNYKLIEKAKATVPVDTTDEKYYTLFFTIMVQMGVPLKEAIKEILKTSRQKYVDVNLQYLKEFITTDNPGTTAMGEAILPSLEECLKLQEKLKPKGYIGQLIWIYLFFKVPPNKIELKYNEIRHKLLNNPAEG